MSEREPRAGRPRAPIAQLSLLDRLDDREPERPRDPPASAVESLMALRRSVCRDVEVLLNSRRRWRSWPARYTELALSPVGYGIADFSTGAFNDPGRRDLLRAEIERTIRHFEPRLLRVRVSIVEGGELLEPTLRLRVDATLRTEPAPEPIVFDTFVDPLTAQIVVRPGAEPAAPEAERV
jgi:type VI secretion system protein ImpF